MNEDNIDEKQPPCIIYTIENTLKLCQLDLFRPLCPRFLPSPPPSNTQRLSVIQSLAEGEPGQNQSGEAKVSSGGTWHSEDPLTNIDMWFFCIYIRLMFLSTGWEVER